MSKIHKILPCPCCKGQAKIYLRSCNLQFYKVKCAKCGLQTDEYTTVDEAVEKWNERKPIDDIVERLDKLEDIANGSYRTAKYTVNTARTMDYYDGLEEAYRDAKGLVKGLGKE